jgi:hypothetical protein
MIRKCFLGDTAQIGNISHHLPYCYLFREGVDMAIPQIGGSGKSSGCGITASGDAYGAAELVTDVVGVILVGATGP